MAFPTTTLRVSPSLYFRIALGSRRCYALETRTRKERSLRHYKKSLSATRIKFKSELDAQSILAKNEISQAAEDARREKEREDAALEENEREINRMADMRLTKECQKIN